MIAAGRAGDAAAAIKALGAFRVLCAHRRGAYGVSVWTARIEGWLAGELERGRWYPGRPLLVTENDYGLRLYNGDTGVVVAAEDGRTSAAFERRGAIVLFPPVPARGGRHRLRDDGAQGAGVAVRHRRGAAAGRVVAGPHPRVALHRRDPRAQNRLILAGTEETIRAAVARPVARASGLGQRLRDDVA